jgi:hypothetical protein
MRAPFSFIKSGASVFDPATLALTGWWRADYSASPWNGIASASSSGGRNLTEATNPPTAGTSQNGKVPAAFNGTNSELSNATAMSTMLSASTFTLFALFRATTAQAAGSPFAEPLLFGDTGGNVGMTFTTSGVGAFCYGGGTPLRSACGTGAYHCAMMRLVGGTMGVKVDSNAEATATETNLVTLTGTVRVSRGNSGGFFDGRILEILVAATDLTASYTNIKSYFNSRYALAL